MISSDSTSANASASRASAIGNGWSVWVAVESVIGSPRCSLDEEPVGRSDAVRGTRRPAAAVDHSSDSHVSAASVTCTHTISAGSSSAYWSAPTARLEGEQREQHGHGPPDLRIGLAAAQQQPHDDGRHAHGGGDARVLVDRPVERARRP